MIIAGFDEAGYGPRLGPLCVAWTAFRVPDGGKGKDLFDELQDAVRREGGEPESKLWIADSKVVRPRADGLKNLELATLAFLRAAGTTPIRDGRALLAALGDDSARAAGMEWYDGLAELRLPAHGWDGEVRAHADRLAAASQAKKIAAAGAALRVVPEWVFNEGVRATNSKSAVLSQTFGSLLQELRDRFPGERVVALCDKHGSRDYYGPLLGTLFPGCRMKIERQSPESSAYRLQTEKGPIAIAFEPKADGRSLTVALASMMCKYVRELFMERLNAFFAARLPGLKPTAGYPQDADRFLRDAQPALVGIPMEQFVRAR